MRSLRWVVVAAMLLGSIGAFGNSTSFINLGASFNIGANDGSGGNLGGTILGTGVNLTVGGGTPFDWLNGRFGIAPGSGGEGGTTIFFDFAFGQLGGQTYDSQSILLIPATLNAAGSRFQRTGRTSR